MVSLEQLLDSGGVLREREVRDTLAMSRVPAWQRRPPPSDAQADFRYALFHSTETALDPHDGPPVQLLRHWAVGERGRCWWRCGLCFYDAVEGL